MDKYRLWPGIQAERGQPLGSGCDLLPTLLFIDVLAIANGWIMCGFCRWTVSIILGIRAALTSCSNYLQITVDHPFLYFDGPVTES